MHGRDRQDEEDEQEGDQSAHRRVPACRVQAVALGRAFMRPNQAVRFLYRGIERLADLPQEIEEGEQQDVGHRELVAGDEGLAAHQPVEPDELLARAASFSPSAASGMQWRRSWNIFSPCEKRKPLAAGSSDVEVDAADPHACRRALFRRVADQRGRVLLDLVDVLADRGDLGQHRAVVEFERRTLARRIDLEKGLAPVLAAAQIDLDPRHVEALLGHEHPDHVRVGADRIVEFHFAFPPSMP